MSTKNKTVRPLTEAQINKATHKAYDDYVPSAKVTKHRKADISTRLARYKAGKAAQADGFSAVPSAKDATRTEKDIRGKGAPGKKTMEQLYTSASAQAKKLDSAHKEKLFAELGRDLGYDM